MNGEVTKTDSEPPLDLAGWVQHINENEMPVFAHTVQGLAEVMRSDNTPVAELAQWILQDSAMTARVLKMANSVYYNPSGKQITTVSLAVLMLGYDTVSNIALSISMIDSFVKGISHDHVVTEMARSFHAAVQAKSIAIARGMSDVEEIYIAALLYRLGHMAFWCFPKGLDETLDAQYKKENSEEDAEQKVLGFTLKELTLALNKEWNLSPLLSEALLDENQSSDSIQDLTQGYQLVQAIEHGWASGNAQDVISKISDRTSLTSEETVEMIRTSSKLAAQTAADYGAMKASKRIQIPDDTPVEPEHKQEHTHSSDSVLELQFDVMKELTSMLSKKVDLNAILGTVIEGIYRALIMDRTVLAMISPDGEFLASKYILSEDRENFSYRFNFKFPPKGKEDIITYVLKSKEAIWFSDKNRHEFGSLMTDEIQMALDTKEFFIFPLTINDVSKGVIYADCKITGRVLSEQDFAKFNMFCDYASIAFKLIK